MVLTIHADGWIQFRYAPPVGGRSAGTAWLHKCHLRGHNPELRFESWKERFLSDCISPLYFRSPAPYVLRALPGTGSGRVGIIVGGHHLEPLEVTGDWMRVIVTQPSDYCVREGALTVATRTSWVKWRSPNRNGQSVLTAFVREATSDVRIRAATARSGPLAKFSEGRIWRVSAPPSVADQ